MFNLSALPLPTELILLIAMYHNQVASLVNSPEFQQSVSAVNHMESIREMLSEYTRVHNAPIINWEVVDTDQAHGGDFILNPGQAIAITTPNHTDYVVPYNWTYHTESTIQGLNVIYSLFDDVDDEGEIFDYAIIRSLTLVP